MALKSQVVDRLENGGITGEHVSIDPTWSACSRDFLSLMNQNVTWLLKALVPDAELSCNPLYSTLRAIFNPTGYYQFPPILPSPLHILPKIRASFTQNLCLYMLWIVKRRAHNSGARSLQLCLTSAAHEREPNPRLHHVHEDVQRSWTAFSQVTGRRVQYVLGHVCSILSTLKDTGCVYPRRLGVPSYYIIPAT